MAQLNAPMQCANCLYPLEEPGVVVNGTPYCCSGCSQGGPCVCSYGNPSSERQRHSAIPMRQSLALPEGGSSPAASFAGMVENMVKEVEITRQVISEEAGPVNDLLALLDKATRLLQVMAGRLEGSPAAPSSGATAHSPLETSGQDRWEKITLIVENATEPDIAFSYTRALSKLDSVRDMKLVSINKANLVYQVETRSKAKFARQVMSLPTYRPVRIQATLDEVTVRLNGRQDPAGDLERLLSGVQLENSE